MRNLFIRTMLCFAGLGMAALLALPSPTHSAPEPPQAARPSIAQPATELRFNNKNGLITVQDKTGKYLFARLIATPTLRIDVSKPAHSRSARIVLSDGDQKKLWETTVTDTKLPTWFFKLNYTRDEYDTIMGYGMVLSSKLPESPEDEASAQSGVIVLARDGFPESMTIGDTKSKIVLARTGLTFAITPYTNGKAEGSSSFTAIEDHGTQISTSSGSRAGFSTGGSITPGRKSN